METLPPGKFVVKDSEARVGVDLKPRWFVVYVLANSILLRGKGDVSSMLSLSAFRKREDFETSALNSAQPYK
jgi:hypothetical protein